MAQVLDVGVKPCKVEDTGNCMKTSPGEPGNGEMDDKSLDVDLSHLVFVLMWPLSVQCACV